MILTKKFRNRVREIARKQYHDEFVLNVYHEELMEATSSKSERGGRARQMALEGIRRRVRARLEKASGVADGPFNSVITSFLLSLALKYAMKLITHWIENKLFTKHQTSTQFALKSEPTR